MGVIRWRHLLMINSVSSDLKALYKSVIIIIIIIFFIFYIFFIYYYYYYYYADSSVVSTIFWVIYCMTLCCAWFIVLLKLITYRHEALHGLFATAELYLLYNTECDRQRQTDRQTRLTRAPEPRWKAYTTPCRLHRPGRWGDMREKYGEGRQVEV